METNLARPSDDEPFRRRVSDAESNLNRVRLAAIMERIDAHRAAAVRVGDRIVIGGSDVSDVPNVRAADTLKRNAELALRRARKAAYRRVVCRVARIRAHVPARADHPKPRARSRSTRVVQSAKATAPPDPDPEPARRLAAAIGSVA